MKTFSLCGAFLAVSATLGFGQAVLPDSFTFNLFGDFANPVPESGLSQSIIDNDLTDGHSGGFDLTGVPSGLSPFGPVGSAAFQWGDGVDCACYPAPSALWFEPASPIDAVVTQPFTAGFLHFRNGSIYKDTGVSGVTLNFSSPESPGTIAPISVSVFNTAANADSFLAADYVQLSNLFTPIPFTDAVGNPYTFELSMVQDLDFGDGSYVSGNEFRVAEGTVGRAELIGRFYTTPIPEPSSLLLAAIGGLVILRRIRSRFRHEIA